MTRRKEKWVFSWWFPVKRSKWQNAAVHHLNVGMFSIYRTLIWFALRCNSERRGPLGCGFSAQSHLTTFSVWVERHAGRPLDQISNIPVLREKEQRNLHSLCQTCISSKANSLARAPLKLLLKVVKFASSHRNRRRPGDGKDVPSAQVPWERQESRKQHLALYWPSVLLISPNVLAELRSFWFLQSFSGSPERSSTDWPDTHSLRKKHLVFKSSDTWRKLCLTASNWGILQGYRRRRWSSGENSVWNLLRGINPLF